MKVGGRFMSTFEELKRAARMRIESIEVLIVLELTTCRPNSSIDTRGSEQCNHLLKEDFAGLNYPEREPLDTVRVLRKQPDIICLEVERLN